MNLLLKACLFCIILLSLHDLNGQTNFRPGYLITNDNDTLHGLIDYRSDIRNSKKCDFKERQGSAVKEYLPFSIKGYRFTDSKFYISKCVKIKDKDAEIQVFLEFLINGISDLYYLNNGSNSYYFIEKADGELFELNIEQKNIKIDNEEYTLKTLKYIGLLRYAFADCPQIFPLINKVELDDKSLIEITKSYHDYVCDGEKCVIYEKQLPGVKVTFAPFVSMNGSFLKFGNIFLYDGIHFKMENYPTIGILLNTSLPKANEKLSFQVSGEFGKSYYYGTGINPRNDAFEEVHLHTSILKGKAGLKYTYPTGKIRPTLLIGGTVSKLFNIDGRRVEELLINSTVYTSEVKDVPVANVLLGYHVNLGIDYYISSSLIAFFNLGYDDSFGRKSLMDSNDYSTDIKTINLNAGIYF